MIVHYTVRCFWLAAAAPRGRRGADRRDLWTWHEVGANPATPRPKWCDLVTRFLFDVDGVSCGNAIMKTNERKSNSRVRDRIK
jgi:hypothetical protein